MRKPILVLVLLLFGVPLTAQDISKIGSLFKATKEFTPEEEQAIGREVAAKVLGIYKLYTADPALTRYVNLVGQYVARSSDEPNRKYYFAVLDTDTINAYSCPGGYIFVAKGLLDILDNEAELAVVLGHEIAHVTEKHILKEVKRANLLSAGTGLAADQAFQGGGMGDELARKISQKAMEVLLTKGLAKKDEYASDEKGFVTACRAGYSSAAYFEFLKKMDQITASPGMAVLVKTHPQPAARLKELQSEECKSDVLLPERFREALKR
jgi:predicted Zn-dependent protease